MRDPPASKGLTFDYPNGSAVLSFIKWQAATDA
jgi:hypothetical protein